MRIGLVSEYFPPHAPGGAEWSTYYLGCRLVQAGHKVVVITPNYGAPAHELREGITIYRYWFPQKLQKGRLVRPTLHSNPLFYLYSAFHIWRRARQEELEVLHAQAKYSLPGAFIASRLLRIPCVFTLRDCQSLCANGGLCLQQPDRMFDDCGPVRSLRCLKAFDVRYNVKDSGLHRIKFYIDRLLLRRSDLWLRKWFLQRVDGVIAVSDGLRDIYLQAGLISPSISRTVYNIPPIDVLQASDSHSRRVSVLYHGGAASLDARASQVRARHNLPDGAVVLTVGKMSFGKGTDVLLQAVPKVLEVLPNATFVLVGRENPLIVVPYELKDNVRMLGVLPHEEVMDLYAAADVVTVPSVSPEALSRVLLEAMSVGKPVVATRVGGTPEVVENGQTGLLVAAGNPTELAEALVCLLQDPGLRKRMGERGRVLLSERFDPDRLVKEYVAFLRDTLEGK